MNKHTLIVQQDSDDSQTVQPVFMISSSTECCWRVSRLWK